MKTTFSYPQGSNPWGEEYITQKTELVARVEDGQSDSFLSQVNCFITPHLLYLSNVFTLLNIKKMIITLIFIIYIGKINISQDKNKN